MKKILLKNDAATNHLGSIIASEILHSSSMEIEIHLQGDLGGLGKHLYQDQLLKTADGMIWLRVQRILFVKSMNLII